MRPSRYISAVLIAMWLLTPDVLCLLPGGLALTLEEHECCERMAGECGRVPMPDVHKCCQTVTPPSAVITAKSVQRPELEMATTSSVPPITDGVCDLAVFKHGLASLTPSPPSPAYHATFDIL
jgi:hypothetical protein